MLRVDSGIVEGDEISTDYDPMIAKLIVWGKNREAALTQMHHALGQFHVDGLGNNIAFLDRLVLCDSFKNARSDTGLIQREEEFLLKTSADIRAELVVSAALIELLSHQAQNPVRKQPGMAAEAFWRLKPTE